MICDECETVAHCLKNGCVPKQLPSKDEALKLALEALKWIKTGMGCNDIDATITAIKQALSDAMHLAAPVQQSRSDVEPVARVHTFIGPEWAVVQVLGEFNLEDALYTTPPAAPDPKDRRSAWVHATPWRGLTDEEIEQGCKESWVTEQAFQSVVWWAEAKLKEKNSD
jgi:hypothetical protein